LLCIAVRSCLKRQLRYALLGCALLRCAIKTQEAFYQRSAAARSMCVNGPLEPFPHTGLLYAVCLIKILHKMMAILVPNVPSLFFSEAEIASGDSNRPFS